MISSTSLELCRVNHFYFYFSDDLMEQVKKQDIISTAHKYISRVCMKKILIVGLALCLTIAAPNLRVQGMDLVENSQSSLLELDTDIENNLNENTDKDSWQVSNELSGWEIYGSLSPGAVYSAFFYLPDSAYYELRFNYAANLYHDSEESVVNVVFNGALIDTITPKDHNINGYFRILKSQRGPNILAFEGSGNTSGVGCTLENLELTRSMLNFMTNILPPDFPSKIRSTRMQFLPRERMYLN